MSGQSDDDTAKEIIYRALKVLSDSAEKNQDFDLVADIEKIKIQVYELETY